MINFKKMQKEALGNYEWEEYIEETFTPDFPEAIIKKAIKYTGSIYFIEASIKIFAVNKTNICDAGMDAINNYIIKIGRK